MKKEGKEVIENLSLENKAKNEEGSIVYQYIFKVILIGDANIGKTSLINRYVTNSFQDKYICTIGVDFMMKSVIYDDQILKLQIWDTAGMEKYKQITTSYYRGAQAAIICFDLTSRSTFLSLGRWAEEFSHFCNPNYQKIVVIVGNKSDLIEEREVSNEEIQNFIKLNNYIYYETSAKTGDNVENLFLEMAKNLYTSYKNNMNTQIRNSVQTRKVNSLNGTDKFQNLMINSKNNKRKGCC
jgi:small GTP-binding protein